VIWRYSECVHHDFNVDETGKIYAIAHNIEHKGVDAAPHLRTPYLRDYIAVLSPEGKELKCVSIFDAFAKSDFRSYLDSIPSSAKGDHTHANGISVVSEAFAKKHGFCSTGNVLISIRNPSLLAIVNLDREEVVWAAHGIWQRQHDPDILENGNIMVFDNLGNLGAGGRSRVLEWNPVNGAVAWRYCGNKEKPFESSTRGCQQLLPNGNVLITESNAGRLLEVTHDDQIVWEFCSPDRSGDNNELVAMVTSGQRYDADDLTFLEPGRVIKTEVPRLRTATKKGKAR
jgi:hypothetical protein